MQRTTIMNKLHNCKRASFLAALLFTFISCSNLVQQNTPPSQQDKPSVDGKTYLVMTSATVKKTSRTAQENFGPKTDVAKAENLTNLKIFGKLNSGTEKKLAEAETYDQLLGKTIPVQAGNYDFTLTAELNGIPFSGTTTKQIKEGKKTP